LTNLGIVNLAMITLGSLALAQTRLPDGGQAWQNLTHQR